MLVLKLGVDINTCDAKKHRSPLLVAAQNGHPLLVLFCVRNRADVSLVDADGDTAVHWAAYKGATEIVAVFQYLQVSSDAPDKFGQTPLHLAAMRGELSTVQFLVETLDADVKALDSKNRTPKDLAQLKHFRDVVRYLKQQELRVAAWNVAAFTWWCDPGSRAPYHFTMLNAVVATLVYLFVVFPLMPDRRNVMVPHLAWNAVTWYFSIGLSRPSLEVYQKTTRSTALRTIRSLTLSSTAMTTMEMKTRLERALVRGRSVNAWSAHFATLAISRDLHAPSIAASARLVSLYSTTSTCQLTMPYIQYCAVTNLLVCASSCPFVDNCVGRDNYAAFLLFVIFLALDLAGMEYVLYLLCRWHHDMRIYAVIGMVYLLFIFLPVGQLAGFHIYLTAKNRTTNELLNADRYRFQRGGELRSYDRGIIRNVAERCFGLGGEPVEDEDAEVKAKLLDEQLSSVPA